MSSKKIVTSPVNSRQTKRKKSCKGDVNELLLVSKKIKAYDENCEIDFQKDVQESRNNSLELRRSVASCSSSKSKVTSPIKDVGLSKVSGPVKGKARHSKKTATKKKNCRIEYEEDVLKSQINSLDDNGSALTKVYQPKLPIWDAKQETVVLHRSLTKPTRLSNRLSRLKNDEIYNFPSDFSPEKKCKNVRSICSKMIGGKEKKHKQRKPAIKKTKKTFKGTLKPMLLTTDLTWETLLSKNFPVKTFYRKNDSKAPPDDVLKCSLIPVEYAETETHSFDDTEVDDAGYEASVSMAYETNETHISSVNASERMENNAHLPFYDIGLAFPTPKLTNRYLGTTSTPRSDGMENQTLSKPACVQEEMKICFGFDEAEECNFGFSPVQRSHFMSSHHISDYISSDTGEIDPQPTRFAVPLMPSFRCPLSQVQNLQYKNRHTSNCNTAKIKKKSVLTKHVPILNYKTVSTSAVSQGDKSTLFNCIDENSMEGSDLPEMVHQISRKENRINLMATILSPAKNFIKPPRKSYTRENIVAVKRKFHAKLAGGYSTAESETEADEDVRKKINKRKKKGKTLNSALSSNLATLPRKKYAKEKENLLQKDKSLKSNKTQSGSESSIDEWASDVNSHFSEVEEMALVVE